jgi:hypothetical protein
MSKANGGTAAKPNTQAVDHGKTSEDEPLELETWTGGTGRQALRTVVAIGYVPIAVTEQLFARSQPLAYYAGVAALATVGLIDWPVAGVVATGVWVARHHPTTGTLPA